jgi:RND family efflux transporter MFP subunit
MVLCFLLLWAAACTRGETKSPASLKKVPVQALRIAEEPKEEVLRLLGTIEADREFNVAFTIGGKIEHLAFEEGQLIRKGALLGRLETTELMARKAKALENKSKAERDLKRIKRLYQQNIVPKVSFQDTRSLLVQADAELTIIQDHLRNSTVRAPFSGRITDKRAEPGEIVAAGVPIALLTDTDPILVRAAVPDNLIRLVRKGQDVSVRVDAFPERPFRGTVFRLESRADPLSRTICAEIRIPNPDDRLKPGFIAKVEIRRPIKRSGIFIPLDAVVGFGADPAVFVVYEGTAERRLIETGKIMGEKIEVLEGLEPGEMLVIAGQSFLKDTQSVRIR